ncbi:hypothetical protein Tco_1304147 [Tanacetum coccineum]
MVPRLWSLVKVAYYKDVALGISHWGPKRKLFYRYKINSKSRHDVFFTMKILSVIRVKVDKQFGYHYLEEIVNKLFNLPGDDIVNLVISLRMFTRASLMCCRVGSVPSQDGVSCAMSAYLETVYIILKT